MIQKAHDILDNIFTEDNSKNKIKLINELKLILHEVSPLKNEPVDCVLWVENDKVAANDYNPNSVAPPEMELLMMDTHSQL